MYFQLLPLDSDGQWQSEFKTMFTFFQKYIL